MLPERLEAPQLRPNLGAALLTGRLERLGGDPVSVAGAPGSTGDSVAGPLVRHRATRMLESGLLGAWFWTSASWLARSRALAGRRTICGLACALTRVPSPISAIGRRTWICPSDRRGRHSQCSGRDEHRQELSGAGHIWNLLSGAVRRNDSNCRLTGLLARTARRTTQPRRTARGYTGQVFVANWGASVPPPGRFGWRRRSGERGGPGAEPSRAPA